MKEGMIYQLLARACRDCRLPFKPSKESEDMEVIYRFTELIVRECAQIADDGFASSNFGNGITGQQLLKHFGIEE